MFGAILARIVKDFAQIFRDFALTFDKSKLLEVRLSSLHPCLLHPSRWRLVTPQ